MGREMRPVRPDDEDDDYGEFDDDAAELDCDHIDAVYDILIGRYECHCGYVWYGPPPADPHPHGGRG